MQSSRRSVTWYLSPYQFITYHQYNKIAFRHKSPYYRGVALTKDEFIQLYRTLSLIQSDIAYRIPLTENIWFTYSKENIKIVVYSKHDPREVHRFFQFTTDSWKRFNDIHTDIYLFLSQSST